MAVVLYLGSLALMWRNTIQEYRSNLSHINSMLVQGARTTLKGHELILRGLAGELIQHGALDQPEQGRALIERMKSIDPGMAGFGLARPDGQLVLVSGIPPGQSLPNLANRHESAASFAETLASRHIRTGRPYFFARLKGWVVPIRVSIEDPSGNIQAVMTAGYRIDGATASWSNMRLPEDVKVALVGDDGYLRYVHPLPSDGDKPDLAALYRDPIAPDVFDWIKALPNDTAFQALLLPRAGRNYYIAYQRIPELNLHSGAFVPVSVVVADWARRLLLPTSLLGLFLGGGWWAYRRADRQQTDANRRLQESRVDLMERNESLGLLNKLSRGLQGSLDLNAILDQTINALLSLEPQPRIAIYLVDSHAKTLRLAASHGFGAPLTDLGEQLPMSGSLTGQAVTEKHTQISHRIATDSRLEPGVQNALAHQGAAAAISIPMICRDESLGTINLIYEDQRLVSDRVQQTLKSLSNTVGLAIANARHLDRLEYDARHDSLTGLPNRIELHGQIAESVEQLAIGQRGAALLLLDLDRFKEVNDTLGHHFGDLLLATIGPRLAKVCDPQRALAARIGGDEFAVFLTSADPREQAPQLAAQLVAAINEPCQAEGLELRTSASIGIAYFPEDGSDSHALLRAADVAMYRAKALAAGVLNYDKAFDCYSTERLALVNELERAFQQDELCLHYQPKIGIDNRTVAGVEALVRWQHPRLGLLYPGSFIDLVEMSELIHPFTAAVIERAVIDRQALTRLGHQQTIAINLSARNLLDERCIDCLRTALDSHRQPPTGFQLELTETALMNDPEHAAGMLQQVSDAGIGIAIDDYGTGYSSLGYLNRLPIDTLKIDQSFVSDLDENQQNRLIVRSTIALAHELGLKVVAEGVENASTLQLLQQMACDQAQGYFLSRPLTFDQLVAWLKRPASTRDRSTA